MVLTLNCFNLVNLVISLDNLLDHSLKSEMDIEMLKLTPKSWLELN